MSKKRILIVDDEESILTILKSSLKKLGPDYQVSTASDGFVALDRLLAHSYDLVITDFNMAEMDGLELMEAIRYAQPNAQLIMITAFGTRAIENEAKQMKVYRYLDKPLDINSFRKIVQQALAEKKANSAKLLALSKEQYQQNLQLLEQLSNNVGARCVLLTDATGHMIASTGHTDDLSLERIISLLGGGMATAVATSQSLDGDSETINLIYHEGNQNFLYAVNVGRYLLLTIIIKRSPYSSRLGSVWYQARRTALNLRELMEQVEETDSSQIFNEELDQAFDTELDKLLNGDDFD